MQNKFSTLTRIIFCSFFLAAIMWDSQPAFSEKKATPLPKSINEFRSAPVEKIVQAYKDASDENMKSDVRKIISDNSTTSSDWQKLFVVLMETMCETYYDSKKPRHELCAEVQLACDKRFGKSSIESDMSHLVYAVSFTLVEEGRKAWDEYDLAVRSGRLAKSNPDFLVKSLQALGISFGENLYGSDCAHSFVLADQFIATHKVSLPVQADLYSAATERIHRQTDGLDCTDSLYLKFANTAIKLDKQLGPKYSEKLKNVLNYKDVHLSSDKEYKERNKRFEQRRAAHQRQLKKAKKK